MNIWKNIFIGVLLISTWLHTYGQNPNNIWYKGYFEGQIKSSASTLYVAKDHFGKVIKTHRTNNVSVPFDEKIKYDPNGLVLERTRYIDSPKLCIRDDYEYFENRIEITVSDCDNNIDIKHIYKLNNEGKPVEYRSYDSLGTLNHIETTTFSLNGDTIVEQGYDPIKDFPDRPTTTIVKYDQNSNIIEEVLYQFGSFLFRHVYIYNKNKLVEKQWYKSPDENELLPYKVKHYDEKENIVEEITYDLDHEPNKVIKKKYTYEYEYDEKGNWIKKILYVKSIPKFIEERSIVYYD